MSLQIRKKQSGFTIIELLIVIVVIGILVALLIPNLLTAQERARDTDRKNDLRAIRDQLETFYNDEGTYPTELATLVTDGYLDEVPNDPEGDAYTFTPLPADCDAAATACTSYTVSADLENDKDADFPTYSLESLNE